MGHVITCMPSEIATFGKKYMIPNHQSYRFGLTTDKVRYLHSL